MARLSSVNFTGPLAFPYATTATDLFKKEDVQTLAVAVDAHDHSAGKGLALTASAIPNGLITSAMIADGTIATADLAGSAVTTLAGAYASTPTFSTTTVGSAIATPVSVTCTVTGGLLLVSVMTSMNHSVASSPMYTGLSLDGGAVSFVSVDNSPAVSYACSVGWVLFTGATAGSHTFTLTIFNGAAGTLTLQPGVIHELLVAEFKR